jgi:hypothetical protein
MQRVGKGKSAYWHHWGFLKAGCFEGPIANGPLVWSKSFEFTGLLDKNCKEIYEGHIIQVTDNLICEVVWDGKYGKWQFKDMDSSRGELYEWMPSYSYFKIIGHIAEEETK